MKQIKLTTKIKRFNRSYGTIASIRNHEKLENQSSSTCNYYHISIRLLQATNFCEENEKHTNIHTEIEGKTNYCR